MKCEIEVELPEDIAKDWEVARIGVPVDGEYLITSIGGVGAFNRDVHSAITRVILSRKLTPRDWWPKTIIAEKMTLEKAGAIRLANHAGAILIFSDQSEMVDFSWIPEHLRRSGATIENPWKGEQQ